MTMAKVEDTVSLLVPAKTVWYRLIEFNRWDEWLWMHISADAKIALGENMRPLGGEGTEMRFGIFGGGVQKQTMRVTEWDPPRRLAISLEGWNCKSVTKPGSKVSERAKETIGSLMAMSLTYSAEVTPVSDLETRFTFRIEAAMTHPIGGPLMTLFCFIPWRLSMRREAAEFTSRFTQSFEKTRTA
jgi:hypothetical protein